MAIVYKWNKYSINFPDTPAFSTMPGDVPIGQSHSPGNSIAAIAFNDFSKLHPVIGEIAGMSPSGARLWWKLDTSELASYRTFQTNDACFSSSYNHVFIPEFAITGGLVGWNVAYATSGAWQALSSVNEVYHIITGENPTYSDYQVTNCPNISQCTKGTLLGEVTSTNQSAYPTNGIAYVQNFGEAYWYEYVGPEDTTQYAVTLIASPSNGGTVSGGGEYTTGSSVTVQATAANGFEFVGWKEGGTTVSTSPSYSFAISGNRTLTAVFKQKLALWVGVGGKARKGVELYVGVNGKARKATEAWIGVNGKARRFL